MSELRDLATAFRATNSRLDSIEDCLLVLLRNSVQEADWRHHQRNEAAIRVAEREEILRAIKQVENFQDALWKYLGKLDERLEELAKTRHEDISEVKSRLHNLEYNSDEVTKV